MKTMLTLTLALLACLPLGLTQQAKAQNTLYRIGQKDSLHSDILQETREFWVQLPEGFDAQHNTYPVVYVLDGGVHLQALSTVYEYYRGHHLPDMVLVGIATYQNRTRDLTPTKVALGGGAESGGAEAFTQFIAQELIPHIEQHYAASPYRTLIGHSYGGLFTINALLNHKHLFSNYIAIDPSLQWDEQQVLQQAKQALQEEDFAGKALHVSLAAGQLHMTDASITLENIMEDKSDYTLFGRSILTLARHGQEQNKSGLAFSFSTHPNDYHWTVPLPTIMEGMLKHFEWYQLEEPIKFNNPETPLKELMAIVEYRSKKLQQHLGYATPPFPEELYNQSGYMYMHFEQPEKAKAFFEMGVTHYPHSANAHDSMADFYAAQQDVPNAIKHVAKAYALSGSQYHKDRLEELKAME